MQEILRKYIQYPDLQDIIKDIEEHKQLRFYKLITSARSYLLSALYKKISKPFIVVISDKEAAAYLYNDFQKILENENIFFFPSSLRHLSLGKNIKTDTASMMMRTEALSKIRKLSRYIIITYPEAIAEKIVAAEEISSNTIDLRVGDQIDPVFLAEMLDEYGFRKSQFVVEPGQYAIRGSIVDVFSFDSEFPYRIDFFGDEIESIRFFDIETQLSTSKIDSVSIISNLLVKPQIKRISLPEFVEKPENQPIFILDDENFLLQTIDNLFQSYQKITLKDENIDFTEIIEYIDSDNFTKKIQNFYKIYLSNQEIPGTNTFEFDIRQQSLFQKNFKLLAKDLKNKQDAGYQTYICSDSKKQLQRLQEILQSDEVDQKISFLPLQGSIHEGFTDNKLKIALYTDHQIFNRYYKFKLKDFNISKSKEKELIKEISELKPGDYVVHIDYGIGIFRGLTTIENNGQKQEVARIEYKDRDNLFVNVHALHKISKYKSQEAEAPNIHKLGTSTWKSLKKKTKKRIKDIAKDLIALYAKRMTEKGFAFSADTYLQEALEASFIYEETPDQLKAIDDVKNDMEKDVPMDRLVCGDVGFGKTEIAIRAAFKAVADNKQVALLCPTTVLTYQHFRTFSERLKDLPVTVDYISRMRNSKDQKDIIKKLATGAIDIIIGTHRLIGKDVVFKDLGLLIIDEEQKFGVAVKEKLKQLRVNVDTLTLTATPIPRTLQFSLMGARDLSILQTAPPNRQPIITELHTFDAQLIKSAIDYEVNRGGQVFFVHNHRATLLKMKNFINEICPNVDVEIAHGQMKGHEIENVMTGFIKGDFDVLLTTSIIENGLDIPNANTIIINNAHKFGLSDLHQLRGRVGRSSRKAFCYLIAPPKTNLKDVARRRLQAIENFVDLGSGFNIALQDLDIRGAGDLLGAQQSGYINDIGYETFKRILQEAMLELRTSDFKHVFDNVNSDNEDITKFVNDCQITTDLPANIPESYVTDTTERLKLYKQLDSIENEDNILQFQNNLIDRFGQLPKETMELLNIVRLRLKAISLGIEKIILKQNSFICYFINDKNSAFYDSQIFISVLNNIGKSNINGEMKEKNEKLLLRFDNVSSIKQAYEKLETLCK